MLEAMLGTPTVPQPRLGHTTKHAQREHVPRGGWKAVDQAAQGTAAAAA